VPAKPTRCTTPFRVASSHRADSGPPAVGLSPAAAALPRTPRTPTLSELALQLALAPRAEYCLAAAARRRPTSEHRQKTDTRRTANMGVPSNCQAGPATIGWAHLAFCHAFCMAGHGFDRTLNRETWIAEIMRLWKLLGNCWLLSLCAGQCAGLSKILLILGRLRRFLPGPKLDSVQITSRALF
jgi:hypothetical protein